LKNILLTMLGQRGACRGGFDCLSRWRFGAQNCVLSGSGTKENRGGNGFFNFSNFHFPPTKNARREPPLPTPRRAAHEGFGVTP
jgi:hypothetical protein